MSHRHWHLIAYDVRDPKRPRQTAKILEGFGTRVQYSIFRCRLTDASLQELRWRLEEVLATEDDLLIIPLCHRCSGKVEELSRGDRSDWGTPPPSHEIL